MHQKLRRFLKENLSLIIFIVGLVFFRTAVADWSYVPSGSMEPTFYDGDYVLVNKTSYGPSIPFTDFRLASFGKPKRGDIITFYPPHSDKQFVKRVIGTPGDTIRVDGLSIYLNDKQLPLNLDVQGEGKINGWESINGLSHKVQVSGTYGLPSIPGEIVVPENKYFVLGDHRNNSQDSRYWGFVDEDKIVGRVTHVAFSFSAKRPLLSRFALKIL